MLKIARRAVGSLKLNFNNKAKREHSSSPSSSTTTPNATSTWKGLDGKGWSVKEMMMMPSGGGKSMEAHGFTSADVERLANLSYLNPPAERMDSLRHDIANILLAVNQIQSVDTSNVEPLISVLEHNKLKQRVDKSPEGKYAEEETGRRQSIPPLLANATKRHSAYFVVPKQKQQPWEDH